jgi:septal ring factor EnvC (AmiA/AmiB activator)
VSKLKTQLKTSLSESTAYKQQLEVANAKRIDCEKDIIALKSQNQIYQSEEKHQMELLQSQIKDTNKLLSSKEQVRHKSKISHYFRKCHLS